MTNPTSFSFHDQKHSTLLLYSLLNTNIWVANLGLIVSLKNVKLGPINSLSSQLNDPHFMHETKLVKFGLILSKGQRTKVVDKQKSLFKNSWMFVYLFVTLNPWLTIGKFGNSFLSNYHCLFCRFLFLLRKETPPQRFNNSKTIENKK